ncbi:carboxymuconolactone decarboxylase family protein [Pseudonocardia sp. NPDC046786]|uniref:carboxymuconolactone decarboxylase family protein n=1 Tax=Pseudonocardia sp. NPDC046786 TaxID=3155471 RepID=UPI0033D5AAA6
MSAHGAGATETGERVARALFGDERYEASRIRASEGYRRELLRLADDVVFGTVYASEVLPLRERSLCTVAALTVLGREQQLAAHIGGALNVGVTEEEVAEVVRQMAMYGGFPAALNAMAVAENVFAARNETAT